MIGKDMEKRYFVGRIQCGEDREETFTIEYYLLECRDLFSIEIVKERTDVFGESEDVENITSYPISHTRSVVERIARILLRNAVTPATMYECLDDMFEI
ncbi:MAG: hypothetical protein E7241_06560 [Lachnospiraceae bacterium]|nr:hypothetical protein [Lachnospiraceae bacterium]